MPGELKCNSCGASVRSEMRFCAFCGSPLKSENPVAAVDDAAPKTEKKKKIGLNIKKLLVPLAAVVVVAAVIFVAVLLFKPDKYGMEKGEVYAAYTGDHVVVYPHGKGKVNIDGFLMSSEKSLDGTKAAILVDEQGSGYGREGYNLYYIADEPVLIDRGVRDYWLSASGDKLAYAKEYDSGEDNAELWMYSNGKNYVVSEAFNYNYECAISPDGGSLGFVINDGNGISGTLWNGNTYVLGEDTSPAAVADGLKYIYYRKGDSLYVKKGPKSAGEEKIGDYIISIIANKDFSQVICSTYTRSYLCKNGRDTVLLSGLADKLIVPDGTAFNYLYSTNSYIYSVSNFADTFYLNDGGSIIHINKKNETTAVAKNVDSAYLARDAKTLLYLRNGSVYKLKGTVANAKAEQLTGDDAVTAFVPAADGGAVFFFNEDDFLRFQKGRGVPATVSNDQPHIALDSSFGLFKGKTLFYIGDGELYFSNGSKGRSIGGVNGVVKTIAGGPLYLYVTAVDDGEELHYRSGDGKKFELIYRD